MSLYLLFLSNVVRNCHTFIQKPFQLTNIEALCVYFKNFKTFFNSSSIFIIFILFCCKELNGQTTKKIKSHHDFVDETLKNVTLIKQFQTLNTNGTIQNIKVINFNLLVNLTAKHLILKFVKALTHSLSLPTSPLFFQIRKSLLYILIALDPIPSFRSKFGDWTFIQQIYHM